MIKYHYKALLSLLILAGAGIGLYSCKSTSPKTTTAVAATPEVKKPRVLVFSKTVGWYHTSIPAGKAALLKLGKENDFLVDTTKNAAYFVEDSLKNYVTVIFLNTTMNVLDADQQVAFERYIQAGGGFVGVHSAADTEYRWPWYNKLVGAQFLSHPNNPNVRKATIEVLDTTHISTKGLPEKWQRDDEWYNYKNLNKEVKVLANLDESSYEGGENGEIHPIAWYHEFDGGRAFYTGGGHTDETYLEPLFLKHLLGGIKYAIGENKPLDFSKSYSVKTPEENRFTKTILTNDLNEPMELAVTPDGRVFFVERTGRFYMYDPTSKKTKLVKEMEVLSENRYGNGILGITIDPDFATNNYVYLFYTPLVKENPKHRISRFVISKDGVLDMASEKTVISFPIELESSAHQGGSLAWDKDKNLYISTGDNTVPFESDGYNPIDERKGRLTFDAQRSSGNANDLRGKVLRIHPEADGSYTIPQGNLFPEGTPGTRPEIYTMGLRNPYRIAVDKKTSILYWGEIGPDAGEDGKQGPRGYDEFNQAKKAGNYGWPYFIGDTKIYNEYDFETKAVGPAFDPNAPINNSPNNTGTKTLPPTNKAMIWYPYNKSEEFPELGLGGRSAIAGAYYHFDPSLQSANKIPEFFDNSLFIMDWMRNWVFAVRFDENNNFKRLDPFMPNTGDFRRPIDLDFGPEGAIYMLEYGSVYGIDNDDARLVKIEYNEGNRAPVAIINTNDTLGTAPLKVNFSSRKSYDFDEDDKHTYEWSFDGKTVGSKDPYASFTYQNNGIYKATLKVTDPSGLSSTDTITIKVGNTLPEVAININDNKTFFKPEPRTLKYAVDIKDKEDKTIDKKKVKVSLNYIPKVSGNDAVLGHQQLADFNVGKSLMAGSDCKACHQMDKKSVGPALMEISKKYRGEKNQIPRLANKIITGGGGVWGEHAMNAHPQLSYEEATDIVKYIYSLSDVKPDISLPQTGSVTLKEHVGKEQVGRYVLTASYTDKGGAITPLSTTETIILRPTKVQAKEADLVSNVEKQNKHLGNFSNNSYFKFSNIDLSGISKLTYSYFSIQGGATLEVHKDSPRGELLSTVTFPSTGEKWENHQQVSAPIKDPGGIHNLYFVLKKENEEKKHLLSIENITFE